jgi:hypothetical protein
MKGVRVDAGARTARARAGYSWADLDHQTSTFRLGTTGGTISGTGSSPVLGGRHAALFAAQNLTGYGVKYRPPADQGDDKTIGKAGHCRTPRLVYTRGIAISRSAWRQAPRVPGIVRFQSDRRGQGSRPR